MENHPVIREVTFKKEDKQGNISFETHPIGAEFKDVYCHMSDGTEISLQTWFDEYIKFLTTNHYLYKGSDKPTNPQTKIWIDTNKVTKDTR